MKRGIMTLGEKSQYRVSIDLATNNEDLSTMTLFEIDGEKFRIIENRAIDSRNRTPIQIQEEIEKTLTVFEKQIK